MVGLILLIALAYLGASVCVGISFFAVFGWRFGTGYSRKAFLGLLVVFAVLDLYWIPAIAPLDMTIIFGNHEVAQAFEAESGIRVNDIIEIGWFDIVVWSLQTALGYFAGMRVYEQILRRGS
jgi:hypothetical protein